MITGRNGTIDLFAAMNVATGERVDRPAQGPCRCGRAAVLQADRRSRAAPIWRYTSSWTTCPRIPHRRLRKWLAHKNRRRWHLHFTPTSSSWLNLIERWFKELTDKRLRRGAFTSVAELSAAITKCVPALEPRSQTVHLESQRRRHHHESPTWPRDPSPDQIADGALGPYSPRPSRRTLSRPISQRKASEITFDGLPRTLKPCPLSASISSGMVADPL